MLRWEILEIIERDNILVTANLYRPLGQQAQAGDSIRLPFDADNRADQMISAALLDGFEPVSQSVIVLPDGIVQKHWVFRLQVIS